MFPISPGAKEIGMEFPMLNVYEHVVGHHWVCALFSNDKEINILVMDG